MNKYAVALAELKRAAKPHYTPQKWWHILNVLRVAKQYKQKALSDEQKAAILWHDSAKKDNGAFRHGEFGARIAQKQLPRWYTPQQVRIVAKAIRQHNLDERIQNEQTFKQLIPNFASPQAELLAVADDYREQNPQATWKKTLSYNITGSPSDKNAVQLLAHMKKRLDPDNRMPQLKYYRDQFKQKNKNFSNWLHALTQQEVADRINKYKKEHGL